MTWPFLPITWLGGAPSETGTLGRYDMSCPSVPPVGREGGRTPFILGDPVADPPSKRPVGCWPAPDAAAAACIVLKDQRKSLTKHSLDVPNTVVDCFC